MRVRRRRGTLTAEALAALFAVMLCLPVTVTVCGTMARMTSFDAELQDAVGILQAQRLLVGAGSVHTDGQVLYFRTGLKDFRMSLVNDHLIIQPGTQIVLADIDRAGFRTEEGVVILSYTREEKQYEAALTVVP